VEESADGAIIRFVGRSVCLDPANSEVLVHSLTASERTKSHPSGVRLWSCGIRHQ
jgi:hypothetical protein